MDLTGYSNCCAQVNHPASVYPSGMGWGSCYYSYGNRYDQGTLTSYTSSSVVVSGTTYNVSVYGLLVWDTMSNSFKTPADASGFIVTPYYDHNGDVNLLVYSGAPL